jgi:glycosyltransferase involved in cell wall biosynthesis
VLADADLRARMGQAARRRVEDRFDIAGNIRAHEDLYLEICSPGGMAGS